MNENFSIMGTILLILLLALALWLAINLRKKDKEYLGLENPPQNPLMKEKASKFDQTLDIAAQRFQKRDKDDA